VKSIVDQGMNQTRNTRRGELSEKDKELQAVLGAHRTKIKIVGTGGAGNNTLSRMVEVGIQGVEIIAVNTDAQDLLYTTADQKILIGKTITNGLGAGSNPQIGADSARENEAEIREVLKDADMVFVTCGLGGGTGTGSAPVVAEIAKSIGALTISVVTLPFSEEGVIRWENAQFGLEKLQQHSDTVIVIQNDKLLEIAPELPLGAAFKVADEVLVNAVKGITELVTEKGLVNLDFADVRAIMKDGGTAMVGIGESDSENRAQDAIQNAITNPLLDVDINGANSALLNISGGSSMSLKDAKVVMRALADKLDPSAKVIWGARCDESLEETLRVMLIVTGLKKNPAIIESMNLPQRKKKPVSPAVTLDTIEEESLLDESELYPVDDATEDSLLDLSPNESVQPLNIDEADDIEEQTPLYHKPTPAYNEPETHSDFEFQNESESTPAAQSNRDNGEKSLFDIRDEGERKQKKAPEPRNKRVFTEIFEEEAQGDLNVLMENIENLDTGNSDIKVLKDIKSACISLKNTAQLFTFDKIEQFTEEIANFIDLLIRNKISPDQKLKEIIEEVPDIINDLMYEDQEAIQRCEEIKAQIKEIRVSLGDKNRTFKSNKTENFQEPQVKKKVEDAFFSMDESREKHPPFENSKMNDAIQHMKKLFG